VSSEDQISDTRALPGAINFRDVARCGAVRPGRLFRSGELSRLNDDGRKALQQIGIVDVADLRSPGEVSLLGPGQVPSGVLIHGLPIPDVATDGESPHEHAWRQAMTENPDSETIAVAATRYMVEEYRRFPTYSGTQRALRRIVQLLADERSVLVHCFAGKDRTGFLVALVLEAIGVDRNAILTDYLYSNASMSSLRSQVLHMIEKRSGATAFITEAQLCEEVIGVRGEYLAAARSAIDGQFGSLTAYLRDAGIYESDVERLRSALLS